MLPKWRRCELGMWHYSVALGWPTKASVIHTIRWMRSGQYQTRPAPVTSYCHCSSSLANDAVSELVSKGVLAFVTPQRIGPKLLPAVLDRSGRLSAELLPSVNGIARCEHHVPAPLGRSGSDSLTSPLRRSLSCCHGAGTRLPNGLVTGRLSRSDSSGSAITAAVLRQLAINVSKGAKVPRSSQSWITAGNSVTNSLRPSSLR